jgi:hypothetical protein
VPNEHFIVPYESLGCICKLDDGDWRNLTLYSANSEVQTVQFGNINYLEDVFCKYSAVVEVEEEGVHKLTVKVVPDEVNSRGDDALFRNSAVYFNVRNVPSASATSTPSTAGSALFVLLIIVLSVSAVAAGIAPARPGLKAHCSCLTEQRTPLLFGPMQDRI